MSALGDRWTGMQKRERTIVVVLGGVILLGLIYLLFMRGGGGGIEGFTTPPNLRTAPRTSAAPTPKPVPETFEIFEGKDPFQPLVAQSTAPQPPPGSPPPSPAPSASPSGQRVVLEAVFTKDGTRYATVMVNGTEYTVKKGDTFAGNYRVLDLTSNCGTFVFGDERFTLCVGQEVLK